jgi:hypothetical protein
MSAAIAGHLMGQRDMGKGSPSLSHPALVGNDASMGGLGDVRLWGTSEDRDMRGRRWQ